MEEIVYVKVIERNIVFSTESICYKGSLTNQLDLILSHFGFARLNQNLIVNLNKIKSFDSKRLIVYFDDEKLNSCQVSRANKSKVPDKFDIFQHK